MKRKRRVPHNWDCRFQLRGEQVENIMKGKWSNIFKIGLAGLGVIIAGSAIKSFINYQPTPMKDGLMTFGVSVAASLLLGAGKSTRGAAVPVLIAGGVLGAGQALGGTADGWGRSVANSIRGQGSPAGQGAPAQNSSQSSYGGPAGNEQLVAYKPPPALSSTMQGNLPTVAAPLPISQPLPATAPTPGTTTVINQAAKVDKNAWLGTAISGGLQGLGAALGGIFGSKGDGYEGGGMQYSY